MQLVYISVCLKLTACLRCDKCSAKLKEVKANDADSSNVDP